MKILIADDHPLFVEGLQNLLQARGLQVVGVAHDGFEALHKARALRPDVILMDIHMPRCNGLKATCLIKAEMPDVKIVMLTISEDDDDLFAAIKSGACGYLLKELDSQTFFDLFAGLEQGQAPFSPGLAARLLREFSRLAASASQGAPASAAPADELTPRQVQILTLAASGLSYKQVAVQLNLSESTIKNHMRTIMQRLHLKNRADVVAYAARIGPPKP
jgi:two-component system NarL family response regulator